MRSRAPRRHTVQGVAVEMHEVVGSSGMYHVVAKDQALAPVRFSRESGENHWYCGMDACSRHSHKLPVVLSHVVCDHAKLSQRPALASVGSGVGDYALGGRHPDPTYDEAIFHMYGSRW